MVLIPKGKKYYIGRHRFIEGDIVPPHLVIEVPVVISAPKPSRTRKPKHEPETLVMETHE